MVRFLKVQNTHLKSKVPKSVSNNHLHRNAVKGKLYHQNDSPELLEFKDVLNSYSGKPHDSSAAWLSRLVSAQDTVERSRYNCCFYNWEVSQHRNDLLDAQKCLEVSRLLLKTTRELARLPVKVNTLN